VTERRIKIPGGGEVVMRGPDEPASIPGDIAALIDGRIEAVVLKMIRDLVLPEITRAVLRHKSPLDLRSRQ
jgi:hypothetical protein